MPGRSARPSMAPDGDHLQDTTVPPPGRAPLLLRIMLLGAALLLAALLPAARSGIVALPALLAGWLVFRHDLMLRWRRPSVWVAGVLGAAATTWGVDYGLCAFAGITDTWGRRPIELALAVPIPWIISRIWMLLPRTAAAGAFRHGEAARRVALAAQHTPWPRCRWQTAGPLVPQPPDPLDIRSSVPVGERELPLHPEGPAEGMAACVKRALDGLLVLLALPLLLPSFALLVLVLKLVQRGPVFYAQARLGLGERHFMVPKLRTMVVDAEPGGVPVWPEDDDPRITRQGRILRRFWLDELPQLGNVLVGSMSLVGPRPERPAFAQAFSARWPKYPLRHRVPVGMTGLAQVNGFLGDTSISRRLRHDLAYARRWSPALDLWILAVTVLRAVRRRPIPRRV